MSEHELYLPEASAEGRLSSTGPAVRVQNVSKSFGGHQVLKDVSFELERGKVYSILGPSGCGKSTLLKAMIGAQEPDDGLIEIDGINVWKGGERNKAKARRKFGVLFQSGALLNGLTCGENVALPLRRHTNLPDSTINMIVRMKLELVGMGHAIDRRPPELSGGMIKRCALARAIALDPAIVFYDEPSAGIDPVMIAVLDHLLLDLSAKLGITSVVITHEIPSALRISDEMILLWGGVVHFRGTAEEFRNSNDPAVHQFAHGSEEGPMSAASSKAAVAARILGIDESELFSQIEDPAHRRGAQAYEEERQRRARSKTERYRSATDSVFEMTGEVRKKHTRRIEAGQVGSGRYSDVQRRPSDRSSATSSRLEMGGAADTHALDSVRHDDVLGYGGDLNDLSRSGQAGAHPDHNATRQRGNTDIFGRQDGGTELAPDELAEFDAIEERRTRALRDKLSRLMEERKAQAAQRTLDATDATPPEGAAQGDE